MSRQESATNPRPHLTDEDAQYLRGLFGVPINVLERYHMAFNKSGGSYPQYIAEETRRNSEHTDRRLTEDFLADRIGLVVLVEGYSRIAEAEAELDQPVEAAA